MCPKWALTVTVRDGYTPTDFGSLLPARTVTVKCIKEMSLYWNAFLTIISKIVLSQAILFRGENGMKHSRIPWKHDNKKYAKVILCLFFRKFLWFFSLNIVIFFLVSYSLIRIVVFWFGFGLDFGQNNRLGSELGKTWILSLSMSVVKYSSIRFNQSAIVISTWVTHYSLFIKRTLAQKKNGSLKITFSQPKVVHSKTNF